MSMSAFQKVTLVTCLVLCVALLLPKMLLSRGKKDAAQTDASPGRFPPMVHRQMAPDSQGQRAAGAPPSRAHGSEAMARAKGAGTGTGTGGKSNLAGQIIPIYGFGILMYILYILFKITSKGNAKPTEPRFPSVRSENMKRKITDFELSQLQEKLRETEMVMEKIVNKASHSPERVQGVSAAQEEALLLQLREITRVMQEGHLVEGAASEKKARDWEGFPEEPHHPYWEEESFCGYHHPSQQQSGPAEPAAERTDVGGADQEEGVAYQGEGGAYPKEGVADWEGGVAYQRESGADQEEGGVAYQGEESGVDQEEGGVAYQGESGADHQEQGGAVDHTGEAGEAAGILNNREEEARTILGDEEAEAERDVGVGVSDAGGDVVNRRKEGGGAESQPGVAAGEMGGAELELTKTSAVQESEERDAFDGVREASASRTRVRRRHKKKRTA